MINLRKLSYGAAVTTVALAMAAPAAIAQTTTGIIRGSVENATGAAVANATVTIVDGRTNRTVQLRTSNSGLFQASGLEIGGPYTVTIEAQGFAATRVEGVAVELSRDTALNLTLGEGELRQDAVTVIAARQVAGQLALGPASAFNLDALESFPSVARDIRDIIRIDPRVQIDASNANGISCIGSFSRFNSVTVDGVRAGDTFGLNNSGFPNRNVFFLPFDAVRETAVEFAPFDVEYGQFTGCAVNIVTKGGSNEFSGSGFATFTSASLTGNDTNGINFGGQPFRDFRYGATFGGPVVKDKLFFFGSFEQFTGTDIVENAPIGAGFGVPQPNVLISDVEQIQALLEARGLDTGGLASQFSETSRRILGRVDWNITDNHRLAFTYLRQNEIFIDEEDNTLSNFGFLNNFEISGTESQFYSARLFSQWTENFRTEINFSRNDVDDLQDPIGGGELQSGDPIARIIVGVSNDVNGNGSIAAGEVSQVVFGPGIFRSANELVTQVDQVKAKADYQLGRHSFTAGYELNQLDVFNLFIVNGTGSIVFQNIAALAAGQATTGSLTAITGANLLSGNIAGAFGSGPVNADVNDAAAIFSRSIHSFYLQDEVQINDSLTVQLGLRYDRYLSGEEPTFNPNVLARYGFSNDQGFSGLDIFLPRFGFTWETPFQFFGRTTFRGGAGVFSGGDPTVWFSNAFTNFGGGVGFGQSNLAPCTPADLNFGPTGPITLPACLLTQQDVQAELNLGRLDIIDPNLELQSVIRANIGLTHITDFGGAFNGFFDDWNVQIDYIRSQTRNEYRFVDLTLTRTGTAADGRGIFDNVEPLNPGCDAVFNGVGQGFSNTSAACFSPNGADAQDILFTNGAGGTSQNVSLILSKSFNYAIASRSGSADLNFGYSYSDVTDGSQSTNAIATTNFISTPTLDPNNLGIAQSLFERTHNITLSLNFSQEIVRELDTRFGLFFNFRSGRPFSFVFDDNDFGLDSGFDRSVLYIPTGPNDPLVQFAPGFNQAEFFQFVDEFNLDRFAGSFVPRNALRSPNVFDLDLRFAQDLPTVKGIRWRFTVDIENFLNLIDSDLNDLRENGVSEDVVDVTNVVVAGQPVFQFDSFNPGSLTQTITALPSVWRVNVGLRFDF